MVRRIKSEPVNTVENGECSNRVNRGGERNTDVTQGARNNTGVDGNCSSDEAEDNVVRRVLRSKYLTVKNRICDERDDMLGIDSDKFKSMIEEVDNLHMQVKKPREQVADAEALFDISTTLLTSVKAFSHEGVTASDFINCLLRDFGGQGGPSSSQDQSRNSMRWKDIGRAVSQVFMSASGCCTMVGPMDTEMKQRKQATYRKRARPTEKVRPEELDETEMEEKTDTDKNMATMFNILRKNRKVKLENLVLNRNCFAQTVENLFALSFLAKDGRAEITVDEQGCHLVSPKNAPSANAVQSGEVSYSHFMFRLDFSDWKLMLASVAVGEELMPHRNEDITSGEQGSGSEEAHGTQPTTPIRKLSRNRGLIMQEQTVVEDSPESGDLTTAAARAAAIRKGKRKLT